MLEKKKQKTKQPLRIEGSKGFKSIIPREGFIEGRQKININYNEHSVIISNDGVLLHHKEGWQFKTHSNYNI